MIIVKEVKEELWMQIPPPRKLDPSDRGGYKNKIAVQYNKTSQKSRISTITAPSKVGKINIYVP